MTLAAIVPFDARMTPTRDLLQRWHAGDPEALGELVAADTAWIQDHVSRRLGALLRQRADTQDIVQHTLVEVLKAGPRFVVDDRQQLRALLARMVENVIRYHARHDRQEKRDIRREVPAAATSSGSVLQLSPAARTAGPATQAADAEHREWIRLALELLEPDDRDVIVWREFDGLPFAEVASRLGIPEAHARVRFQRALPKLGRKLQQLQTGRLGDALADDT